ncbi:MAG: adenylosuccinate synthetase [Myxococcales bacterium]|nr:adenylosuccinate synthetase [Myxococcales bacterium]
MAEPRAWLVVGLGFGDCGKGTITDALVRAKGAGAVIRFSGGAQAGHHVVLPDGRAHTFSQFGAGSFVDGVRTHLASTVVVHPSALLVEAQHLRRAGAEDPLGRLSIGEGCRITTPYHQAAGRLRELLRGEAAHGSCGVGVGETARDALAHPEETLVAGDLLSPMPALRRKLERIRERLIASLGEGARELRARPAQREWALLEDAEVAAIWLEMIQGLAASVPICSEDEALELPGLAESDLVFEGAQGVLLDEDYGFHPHTTWSRCTTAWASAWLEARGLPHAPIRLGVLRTYLTRHGAGPLPSEAPELGPLLPEPQNGDGGWQGPFRRGWPDPVLGRYAIEANGGVDALALTHLDRLAAVERWRFVRAYPEPLELGPRGDLVHQERLTQRLGSLEPELEELPREALARYPEWLERELALPVSITSSGPTFLEKRWR